MTREEEIEVLIEYLKKDVLNTINKYPTLVSDKIIKNGKLIESYKNEYDKIKEENVKGIVNAMNLNRKKI